LLRPIKLPPGQIDGPGYFPDRAEDRRKIKIIEGVQMPNRRTLPGTRSRSRPHRRTAVPSGTPQTLQKLQTLHRKIQLCRQLALEYASRAQTAANKEGRDDYSRIEKSWINLAHSYEFAIELLGAREPVASDNFNIDNIPPSRLH
jgi:hypothetical protein